MIVCCVSADIIIHQHQPASATDDAAAEAAATEMSSDLTPIIEDTGKVEYV